MKINKFINYIQTIFIILIIPALISGPFIPDMLVCLVGVIFIFQVSLNKDYYIFNNNFFYILLIVNIYFIFSSIQSKLILSSFESSLFYFRFIFFTYAFYYLISKFENIINYVFTIIILILLSNLIIMLYEYFHLKINPVPEISFPSRYSGLFGDEKKLGGYTLRILIIFLALLYFVFKKYSINFIHYIALSIFFISLVIILSSGERSALFLCILLFIIYILFLPIKFQIFAILLFLILIFLGVYLYTEFTINNDNSYFGYRIFLIYDRFFLHTINQLNLSEFFSDDYEFILFSNEHHSFAITSLNMFFDKPIFGHGPKLFRHVCQDYYIYGGSCSSHPHNFYLQALSETGIIGFLALILFFIYVCYKIIRLYIAFNYTNNNYLVLFLYLYYFISLFPLIPHGNFFNNWVSILLYFPLALLIHFTLSFKKNV